MLTLNSVLNDLSVERINQVVARGIQAGSHSGSNSASTGSNSMGTGSNSNSGTN